LYFRTDPSVLVLSAFVSLATPLAGTWNAVRKAAGLAPAVAMVPAPPTAYRETFFERWNIHRHISEPTHIIVRHIQRWPLRSGLTALGVAFSGALLVGSLFAFDSIDEMLDSVYFRLNRQDATVKFFEPRSTAAVFEIARWPGVRRAEPIREVPVRLRAGHLAERVTISGVSPKAILKNLIDAEGNAFAIPGHGIVLSEKLAELLGGVQRGDSIQIEILEGARRKREIGIASIVSELIGVSAYMDVNALNRLTGEGPAVTGAMLLLDPAETTRFFGQVKATPATGIVTLRAPAIRTFRETLAQNMFVMISFYVGFGAVIAFGVVYNSARIALSERSRELASLRVLGFTKAEVAYILVGELAILVLLALAPAAVLGYGLAWTWSAGMDTELFRIPLIIERSTYGAAAVVLLVSAAASLAAVAWRVTRLDLIAVLKARE
jgi:putative ABC transport system permease protein